MIDIDEWRKKSEITKKLVRDNFNIKQGSYNKTQLQKDLTALMNKARLDEWERFRNTEYSVGDYMAHRIPELRKTLKSKQKEKK